MREGKGRAGGSRGMGRDREGEGQDVWYSK